MYSESPKEKQNFIKLTYEYLRTFSDKLEDGKRELVLRGNDLVLRTGCRLTAGHVPAICEYLSAHPEVVAVDLAYNCIGDAGVAVLVDFFKQHDSLGRLNLMCNGLTSSAVERLAGVAELLSLASLRINGNDIGPQAGFWLGELLSRCTSLRHLDVAETSLTLPGLAWVAAALRPDRTGSCALTAIDLSRPLGFQGYGLDTAHWASSVGQLLRFNTCLLEVHLRKSEFGDHDMELLVNGLRYNRSLLLLDLGANRLCDDGAARLGRYLVDAPPLRVLLLAHNQIGDQGARSLSFTMPSSRLKMLDISFNKISDMGMQDILNTLKKPIKLETIFIYGNKIAEKSIAVLERLLQSGALHAAGVDVRVWRDSEGVRQVAQTPNDRSTHLYYCVGDTAWPQPRQILPPRPDVAPTVMPTRPPWSARRPGVCQRRFRRRLAPVALCPAGALALLPRLAAQDATELPHARAVSLGEVLRPPADGPAPRVLLRCDHASWGLLEPIVPDSLRDCDPPHELGRAPPLTPPPPPVYPRCFNVVHHDEH